MRYDIGGPPGSRRSEDARWCRKFRLSPAHIRAFLRQSTPITPNEWHHGYMHFPCSVSGVATAGRYKFQWDIEVIAVGSVSQTGYEDKVILACKDDCKARKPFNKFASLKEVVEDHADLPVK